MSLRPKRELSATPTPVSRLDQVLTVGKQNPKTTAPKPIKTEPPAAPEEPVGANFLDLPSVDSTEGITRPFKMRKDGHGQWRVAGHGSNPHAFTHKMALGRQLDRELQVKLFERDLDFQLPPPAETRLVDGFAVTREWIPAAPGTIAVVNRNGKAQEHGIRWSHSGLALFSSTRQQRYRDSLGGTVQALLNNQLGENDAWPEILYETNASSYSLFQYLYDEKEREGRNPPLLDNMHIFYQVAPSYVRRLLPSERLEGMAGNASRADYTYVYLGRYGVKPKTRLDTRFLLRSKPKRTGEKYDKIGIMILKRRRENISPTVFSSQAQGARARARAYLEQALDPTLPMESDTESEWDTDDETPLSERTIPGEAGSSGTTEALEAGVEAMRVAL